VQIVLFCSGKVDEWWRDCLTVASFCAVVDMTEEGDNVSDKQIVSVVKPLLLDRGNSNFTSCVRSR